MSGSHFDVVIVGSGFGGSVAALRLTEKGYRVAVVEAGRRFDADTLPATSWRMRDFLWAPRLGCRGIQRIHLLRGGKAGRVLVLAGAGVGGGSLVYANTLYEPPEPFFADRQWKDITDWRAELRPYYDQASRMLGVVENPIMTSGDAAMKRVAERIGVADSFHMTPVGVYFGDGTTEPGEETADPYFGGAGPRRRACIACGACMTGCRHGAKNMLTANYLYLAERAGATIIPERTVTAIRPREWGYPRTKSGGGGGYAVDTVRTGAWRVSRTGRALTADHVIMAAGTWGTQRLLSRMKATGALPGLSDRLGELARTNSEAILGAERLKGAGEDHSRGLAITSSIHPDPYTHVEPTRYGKGSNAMGLLRTFLIDGGGRAPRWLKFLGFAASHPAKVGRALNLRKWSERTVIALVMQNRDNSLTVRGRPGRFGRGWRLSGEPGHGEPNPTWIPEGHRATRLLAEELDAEAGGTWLDLFDVPTTAHFLGGCVIGDSPETGVIDPYHRVYGHPGLHIVDGSAVSANLGVNPSLTITAQAERAMALWPNAGETDPRPAAGEPYRRMAPVAPHHPVVPAHAPAALRLT